MPPVSVNVKQIDHVTLVVSNLAASRHFYVDILGMRVVSRPDFSFDGLWFQAGSTLIHLILEHPASGPAGNVIPPGSTVSRTRHLAFEVEQALDAQATLDAWGIEIISGPKSRLDGAMQLCILDPDRYVIELFSQ